MASNPHTAWSAFWARNKASGQDGGCIPEGYRTIQKAQQQCWTQFAKTLPPNARVLDLATGDGRVMAWFQKMRRDLKLVGCDMAPELPPPPRGTKVRAGVRMEALPFRDDQFDCAVSQFGFEYGDTELAAKEAARVLKPGGTLAILTHRQDGPILAHNLERRAQIRWVIEEEDLPAIAKNALKLRSAGLSTIPPKIAAAPARGAQLYGAQSAAWEIAEAICQTLSLGARDHPANVARLIDTIVSHAQNELGRIDSLEAACAATFREERFLSAIEAAGFSKGDQLRVHENAQSRPFADFRRFRRV